jgi:hypothetical protein
LFTGTFAGEGGGERRFIWLVNIGSHYWGSDITVWEIFLTLIELSDVAVRPFCINFVIIADFPPSYSTTTSLSTLAYHRTRSYRS